MLAVSLTVVTLGRVDQGILRVYYAPKTSIWQFKSRSLIEPFKDVTVVKLTRFFDMMKPIQRSCVSALITDFTCKNNSD